MRVLITTLAEYQTVFWREVGIELLRTGHDPAFLSYDDRSTEMLRAANLRVYAGNAPTVVDDVTAVFEKYSVSDINHWLSHERFAFGATDSAALVERLAAYLAAADVALTAEGETVMVQELGGFLSVIAAFFVARAGGVSNWFIEPSFFRGRLFFLKDRFGAAHVDAPAPQPSDPALDNYLSATLESGMIVIPEKDRHQYTSARRKIVNWRNARRLVEKVVDKHLLGKRQEFGHIGSHVATHARMLVNSRRLRSHYTQLKDAGPFAYYPLHVPGDMALTLRSPSYLDQIALIDYICRSVPRTHRVAIKEHPAMVGAVDAKALIGLKRRYDHLIILPPTANNYAVMRAADVVITVNSKSGAEAGLLGKPVIVLGDAFYRNAPFARPVDRLQDLPAIIAKALRSGTQDAEATRTFFAQTWAMSHPGELYVDAPANIRAFTRSMIDALS